MIKSADQKIREYLALHPNATKEEVISKVFFGYVGNGEQKKAINRIFNGVSDRVSVDNFDMMNCAW